MGRQWRGHVMDYILETLKREKMHMTLLDPDKQAKSGNTRRIAEAASSYGTDAFMVGGSTGLTPDIVERTIKEIKDVCDLPVIIFPSSVHSVARNADAIYFMSVLNSTDPFFIVEEQVKGARVIRDMGIETISMGYVIVEPGMKVGEVSKAKVVRRGDIGTAVAYALTARYFGMSLVYFEAGSGAPEPIPVEMVKAISESTDIPLVVGGGIRHEDDARCIAEGGADVIVTGTIVERDGSLERLEHIIRSIKETGEKVKKRRDEGG